MCTTMHQNQHHQNSSCVAGWRVMTVSTYVQATTKKVKSCAVTVVLAAAGVSKVR